MPDTVHTGFLISRTKKEKYRRSFVASISVHVAAFLLAFFGQYLLPKTEIVLGTGLGGGTGGDISTVGVVDELSGGAGMVKPSLVPTPPALEEKPVEDPSKAIALPDTLERKIKKVPQSSKPVDSKPKINRVPTPAEPGSGGQGGASGGSGGGVGGGVGISIGSGTGGLESHWYALTVEKRISKNWTKPPPGIQVDIIFKFYIDAYGRIQGIQKEKSSGNPELDYMAERAIRSVKDLTPPPPELRGRLIQFVAHFVYPPNQ
ncbi:MAG: TonB family protein [Acidobacteriota bacterium]